MKNNVFRVIFRLWPIIKLNLYPIWNRIYFRLIGIRFGRNIRVHNKVYVIGQGKIVIGDDFHLTSGDCLNPICRNTYGVLYTMTKEACIIIGNNVGLSSPCLWAKESIVIGNNVNIGGDCIIMDNDAHPTDYLKRRNEFVENVDTIEYYKTIGTSEVVIEDDVWIGARCVVLKGVHIGARSIIAAGSIVTKDIPADVLAGGNPCKVIKSLLDK